MNTGTNTKAAQIIGEKIISNIPVSGGCISKSSIVTFSSGKSFFIKTFSTKDMFIKEANGLKELIKPDVIKVPKVIHCEDSLIILENIKTGKKGKNFYFNFGKKFAQLHKYIGNNIGFYEDNYIGSNIQKNTPSTPINNKNSWPGFYYEYRILYQYKLAEKNSFATKELRSLITKLEHKIETILNGSFEKPSLLHGDLWSGNFLVTESGEPCLIDPAVYYGHREADLAMTKLFGGFSPDFYEGYQEEFPLKPGFEFRENLYTLYHVLNHLNLFGMSYYSHAIEILKGYNL